MYCIINYNFDVWMYARSHILIHQVSECIGCSSPVIPMYPLLPPAGPICMDMVELLLSFSFCSVKGSQLGQLRGAPLQSSLGVLPNCRGSEEADIEWERILLIQNALGNMRV